jgi:DNA invertase Pin-like site-specific DNA recombinase
MEEICIAEDKRLFRTAVYVRLSDGNEGISLQDQVEKLCQFVMEQPELKLEDCYVDDSFSDKNSDRPEFVRLMKDVRCGQIQCVVVRNLECFGCDWMEAGYYMESFLPRLHVRLIAVEADFDSFCKEDSVRFSAFMKERMDMLYSQKLSRIQCEAARIKVAGSDAMPNGSAPFGYRFSEDKKQYLVDPELAPYVRMIFQWVILGVSLKKIAQRMNLLGAVTPGQNRHYRYGKEMPQKKWRADTVYKIIQNPNYTGDICTGRVTQALYKSEGRRWTSPEEWTVRRNAHEALVSREGFLRVQEIMRENRK